MRIPYIIILFCSAMLLGCSEETEEQKEPVCETNFVKDYQEIFDLDEISLDSIPYQNKAIEYFDRNYGGDSNLTGMKFILTGLETPILITIHDLRYKWGIINPNHRKLKFIHYYKGPELAFDAQEYETIDSVVFNFEEKYRIILGSDSLMQEDVTLKILNHINNSYKKFLQEKALKKFKLEYCELSKDQKKKLFIKYPLILQASNSFWSTRVKLAPKTVLPPPPTPEES